MGWQEDFNLASVQITTLLQALGRARDRLVAEAELCKRGGVDSSLLPGVASGWKKWTQDVNSFVLGKVAEVGQSSHLSTSVLATSVQSDPDRRTVFAPSTGLPPLNQEYKVVSAPTQHKASAVQTVVGDAVNQLAVPGRSRPGEMQQAVIEVLAPDNTWPCSYQHEVKSVQQSGMAASQNAHFGGQEAAYNFEILKRLEQLANARRPGNLPQGASIIVRSLYWGAFFRISNGKVLCSRELPS